MQIKNSLKTSLILFLSLFIFNLNLYAEEFNITAKEILLDKNDEVLIGKGEVEAIDSDGNIISADTITYNKSEEFLSAEGNVKITDKEGNILLSKKASYDKINELITTFTENPKITEYNAMIIGNSDLPPVADRLPDDPLVFIPNVFIEKFIQLKVNWIQQFKRIISTWSRSLFKILNRIYL